VTDTNGNLLYVTVHAANEHDTKSGGEVFYSAYLRYKSLKGANADAGYRGTFKEFLEDLGFIVEISEKITPKWEILPKRWCVERTFAWINTRRRLSKDYEIFTQSEEAQIYIAFSSILLKRLL
jgi:putative transposase